MADPLVLTLSVWLTNECQVLRPVCQVMRPVCLVMRPVCQVMRPVCQAMRQTDTGSRPAVYFLCSWRRSTLYVHDDVQRSVFMTTFNDLCSWRRSTFYVHDDVDESTEHLDRNHHQHNLFYSPSSRKQLSTGFKTAIGNEQRSGNNTTVTRCCVCMGVGVGQARYTRLFAGLGHFFIVCQRGRHHVTENLEHIFRSLSATLHNYTAFSLQFRWVSSVVSFILLVHWTLAFQFSFNMNWRATRRRNKTLK